MSRVKTILTASKAATHDAWCHQMEDLPRRLVCATWGGVVMRSWPLFLPTFALFFFFFYVFCFWPTLGKLPRLKICFPHYFGMKNIYKKKLWVIFFLRKKTNFRAFFLLFTASVRSRPPGPPLVPGVLARIIFMASSRRELEFIEK